MNPQDNNHAPLPEVLAGKERRLCERMGEYGAVVVAFSGGVDSSLLAAVAVEQLGGKAVAALAVGPSLARRERDGAVALASELGIRLLMVETKEFENERYVANTGDRCYWCRDAMAAALVPLATERGAALVYGAVTDDLGEDRPGMRAAEEAGMRAPLLEVELSKQEVRILAQRRGLAVWNKPATACLSSRVAIGTPVTSERLARIEKAEDALLAIGLLVVRVRDHGEIARIEIGVEEMGILTDAARRQQINESVQAAGYRYVTVDLKGYRPAGLLTIE